MDSQEGSAEGMAVPQGALASEATVPESAGAQGVEQQSENHEESGQGCGQSLCCGGTDRPGPAEQGQKTEQQETVPQVTNTGQPKPLDQPPESQQMKRESSQEAQPQKTDYVPEQGIVTPVSCEKTEITPQAEGTCNLTRAYGDATTQDDKVKTESVGTPEVQTSTAIPLQEVARETSGASSEVASSIPEVTDNSVASAVNDSVQKDNENVGDVPKPLPATEVDQEVLVVQSPEQAGSDIGVSQDASTALATDTKPTQPTKTLTKEEEILWAPLQLAALQPDPNMLQQMQTSNTLGQLMAESEQLLKDSADLFEDDSQSGSELYEEDQDVKDFDAENEGTSAEPMLAADVEPLTETSVKSDETVTSIKSNETNSIVKSNEIDTIVKSDEIDTIVKSDEIDIIAQSNEIDTTVKSEEMNTIVESDDIDTIVKSDEIDTMVKSNEISTEVPEESLPKSTNLSKNQILSNSISSLSNVLSDGMKILQKIGYAAKPKTESEEQVNKAVKEEVKKEEKETVVSQPPPLESKNKATESEQEQVDVLETKPDESSEADKTGDTPTEILEKSSFVVSDSIADALNESFALLKRFGISKDKDTEEKAKQESRKIPKEKAVHFNDNLYKNYNLMLKLQRDVAKLSIHLSNMKDCVRAIDKDLEELMDATMEDCDQ